MEPRIIARFSVALTLLLGCGLPQPILPGHQDPGLDLADPGGAHTPSGSSPSAVGEPLDPNATYTPSSELTLGGRPLQIESAGARVTGARPRLPAPSFSPPPVDLGPFPEVGPDLTQCSPPEPANSPSVTYVCDCEAGADSDCVRGDDNQPGTGAAPLRSFAAAVAAFEGLDGGGTVALCRGGSWITGEHRLGNSTCSTAGPCRLTDYTPPWASGDEPRPRVLSDMQAHGYLIGIDAGGDWPVGGFVFENLVLRGERGFGVGVFMFRVVNDVRMSCLDIAGFAIGIQAGTFGAGVTLEHGDVHDNGQQGWLGGCNDCGVRRSRFVNNGFELANQGAGAFAHNLYFGQGDGVATNMFVERSYFSRAAVSASDGQCHGTSVVMHGGELNDIRIVGNVVEEPAWGATGGCWGIAVDSGASGFERNRNVLIANNLVRNMGNVSIGLASCVDCTVESNVIVQEHLSGAYGIVMPNRIRSPEDAASDDFVARNNTVYFGGFGAGVGIAVGGEGDDHVVSNNVVAFRGSPGVCYGFDLAPPAYGLVSANLCSGGTFDEGTVGMDAQALEVDPRFVDAPTDLRLAPDSPAVDSGTPVSMADRGLLGRARADRPDRGAYER